jgi:dephospho-CoA kinase
MQTKYRDVHESEWNWAGYPVDYIINNNGTLEDLAKQVEDIRDLKTGEFKQKLKLV